MEASTALRSGGTGLDRGGPGSSLSSPQTPSLLCPFPRQSHHEEGCPQTAHLQPSPKAHTLFGRKTFISPVTSNAGYTCGKLNFQHEVTARGRPEDTGLEKKSFLNVTLTLAYIFLMQTLQLALLWTTTTTTIHTYTHACTHKETTGMLSARMLHQAFMPIHNERRFQFGVSN